MKRDHLLGWPGVLDLIEPEARPSSRTPERVRVVPQFVADSRAMDSDKPPRETKPVDPVEAALRERFNIGDRIRVVGYMPPGARPYGDGDEGVVVGFNGYYVKCHMDRNRAPDGLCPITHWGTEDRPGGCLEAIRHPEKPAQAEPQPDADGWIEHDGKSMPVDGTTLIEVRLRRGSIHKDLAALWHDEDPKYSNWVHEPCQLDILAYRVVPA